MSHATPLRRAPVQRRSAERLTRILDACADLLDEVGYDALSTRAVALRADVPIGSVYRFFGNKRQMADALAQRNLERYVERVTERLTETDSGPDGGGWRAALDAVLDEYLAMKRTAPGFSLIDFGNQIPVGDRHAVPNHRVAERLTELLSGYLGRRPDEDMRRVFLVAVETADTLVQLAFRVAPDGDEKIIEEARELLRAYLGRVLDTERGARRRPDVRPTPPQHAYRSVCSLATSATAASREDPCPAPPCASAPSARPPAA